MMQGKIQKGHSKTHSSQLVLIKPPCPLEGNSHQYDERKTYEEVSIKGAWHTRSFKDGGRE